MNHSRRKPKDDTCYSGRECTRFDCKYSHPNAKCVHWNDCRNRSCQLRHASNKLPADAETPRVQAQGRGPPRTNDQASRPKANVPPSRPRGSNDVKVDRNHRTPRTADHKQEGDTNLQQLHARVDTFWKQLKGTNSSTANTILYSSDQRAFWFECWTAVARGDRSLQPVSLLPKTLLLLPVSTHCLPPVQLIVHVLHKMISPLVSASAKDDIESMLSSLSVTANVFKDRLSGHPPEQGTDKDELLNSLANLKETFEQLTGQLYAKRMSSELKTKVLSALTRVQDIESYERLVSAWSPSVEMDLVVAEHSDSPWLGWLHRPTLGWLMSPSWVNVPPLRSTYADVDDYAETIAKIWTGLTFYWGAGALWPKCCHDQGGNSTATQCAQPLLYQASGSQKCSSAHCSKSATYTCFRRGHDSICSSCLARKQLGLIGSPSKHSSTDIYDGVVTRETCRRDGNTFLVSGLASRKPPTVSPNWNTSYRLPLAGLVAVVRLDVANQGLSRGMPLFWGEVCAYDPGCKSPEGSFRQKGLLGFKLLTSHLDGGSEQEITFDVGSRIAIVDLRVFVPEVIGVLNTVCQPTFSQHLKLIPFVDSLIGKSTSSRGYNLADVENSTHRVVIARAILETDITVIRELSSAAKDKLVSSICSLKIVQCLAGTQLQSFANSLVSAVHCTHGPPGSGKSFNGVALVLALIEIREAVRAAGNGQVGPIIMLSYKNHALDEFLLDVLKWSNAKLRQNEMIRTGKPEAEGLANYGEKSTARLHEADKVLSERISALRGSRKVTKEFRDLANHLKNCGDPSQLEWLSKEAVLLLLAVDMSVQMGEGKDWTPSSAYDFIGALNSRKLMCRYADWIERIGDFVEKAEHWKDPASRLPYSLSEVRALFLMDNWLRGSRPPPRCTGLAADARQCLECAPAHSPYCAKYHACASSTACCRERHPDLQYCDNHRCVAVLKEQPCTHERLHQRSSPFCDTHSCVACINLKCVTIKQRVGAAACEDHQCSVSRCSDMQLFPLGLCEKHICTICARIGVVPAFPRKAPSQFCDAHRCCFQRCKEAKCQPSSYCFEHTCRMCTDLASLNPVDELCEVSLLCHEHRCAHPDLTCDNGRLPLSSFCVAHTCRVCLDLTLAPYESPVLSEAPRNVCVDHILCAYVHSKGKQCLQVALSEQFYCEKHSDEPVTSASKGKPDVESKKKNLGDGSCWGLTKKKKRCRTKGSKAGGGKWYCHCHADQDPDNESDDDVEEEVLALEEKEIQHTILQRQPEASVGSSWVQCCGGTDGLPCNCREFRAAYLASEGGRWQCWLHAEVKTTYDAVLATADEATPESSTPTVSAAPVDTMTNAASSDDSSSSESEREDETSTVASAEDDGFNAHPDELDFEDIPQQFSEDVARLREIADIDDNDDNESDASEASDGTDADDEIADIPLDQLLRSLSWEASHEIRVTIAAQLLASCYRAVDKLRNTAERHVTDARNHVLEVKAASFKAATLIGSTVVGAARRIDALRAAEPFAIVVEEACEVMEPTLISVLAVKSLKKLELIGDHRQLPAFIQNCWFNFEMTEPSIKTSVFERLVTGGGGGRRRARDDAAAVPVPCSVLDEQRRMRKEIADITRGHYADVVTIKDHDQTATQRIGDHAPTKQAELMKLQRELWTGEGREVPGITKPIFFWDLRGNAQGRPKAGLSACNYVEAAAIGRLVSWLIDCGVPRSGITVITPYKGQKTEIWKELRKLNGNGPRSRSLSPEEDVSVHTVDRFQGDENDVIILSLVRTAPGNMFVGLQNRFIVATSRARLGFFIVGSKEAVIHKNNSMNHDGPEHWKNFISDLGEADKEAIGPSLPICCPRHPSTSAKVTDPKDFPSLKNWQTFCCAPCTKVLPPCGHRCQELCHSPATTPHTVDCKVVIPRPCVQHADIELLCCNARGSRKTLAEALHNFECEIMVDYHRTECPHVCSVTCHERECLVAGTLRLADCEEKVDSYFHPACNHEWKSMTCKKRRNYELAPPTCTKKVPFTKPCGCITLIECSRKAQETQNPSLCCEARTVRRPRCGHQLSLRCHQSQTLVNYWRNTGGVSAKQESGKTVVELGCSYGPPEGEIIAKLPNCQVEVEMEFPCGHRRGGVSCHQAFLWAKEWTAAVRPDAAGRTFLLDSAQKQPVCNFLRDITSPICDHIIAVPCFIAEVLESTVFQWTVSDGTSGKVIHQQTLSSSNFASLPKHFRDCLEEASRRCNQKIDIQPTCNPDHTVKVCCSEVLDYALNKRALRACKYKVNRTLKCGHVLSVLCHKLASEEPLCDRPTDTVVVYPCGRHNCRPPSCKVLTRTLESIAAGSLVCPVIESVRRYRCNHPVNVVCAQVDKATRAIVGRQIGHENGKDIVEFGVEYCDNEDLAQPCDYQGVSFKRACKHVISNLVCSEAFEFSRDDSDLAPCNDDIDCVNPLCGHTIAVPCSKESVVGQWRPWNEVNTPSFNETVYNELTELRVIRHDTPLPSALPSHLQRCDIDCAVPVMFIRDCGCSFGTTCGRAVFRNIEPCTVKKSKTCDKCGCESLSECGKLSQLRAQGTSEPCMSRIKSICTDCSINEVDALCYQSNVNCKREVSCELGCGHRVSWVCGRDADPRIPGYVCKGCVLPLWDLASKAPVLESTKVSFIAKKRAEVAELLRGYELIDQVDFEVPIDSLVKTRRAVFKTYIDLMKTGNVESALPPADFGAHEDSMRYRLVLQVVKAHGKKGNSTSDADSKKKFIAQFQKHEGTLMGVGCRLGVLSDSSVFDRLPEVDGVAMVCIGVAFAYREFPINTPFRLTNEDKVKKKANMQADTLRKEGFDFVGVHPTYCEVAGLDECVYWHPGAAVPLGFYALNTKSMCIVCRDSFTRAGGFKCSSSHFICWECFISLAQAAGEAGAFAHYLDKHGNLRCPECQESYDAISVASKGSVAAFEALTSVRLKFITEKEVREAVAAEKEIMSKEIDRIRAMSADEQRAHFIYVEITESILNLRCPRCKHVFVDFDGCFALSCTYQGCQAGFCAYCLVDCGADAHSHVASCPENSGRGYYGTFDSFKEHHRLRKKRLVERKLREIGVSATVMEFLRNKLGKDLKDLGIAVDIPGWR